VLFKIDNLKITILVTTL